jgi:hypothetical protein
MCAIGTLLSVVARAELYPPDFPQNPLVARWHTMGYRSLEVPALGYSFEIELVIGTRVRLIPGVKYSLPSTEITGDVGAYEANRETIRRELERGNWITASNFWIETQRTGHAWDYKRFEGLDADDLGYVMSGYTGESLYPKRFHLSGLGVYRNIDQWRRKSNDFYRTGHLRSPLAKQDLRGNGL